MGIVLGHTHRARGFGVVDGGGGTKVEKWLNYKFITAGCQTFDDMRQLRDVVPDVGDIILTGEEEEKFDDYC